MHLKVHITISTQSWGSPVPSHLCSRAFGPVSWVLLICCWCSQLTVRTSVDEGIINNNIFFAFQGIYDTMINFIFPRMVSKELFLHLKVPSKSKAEKLHCRDEGGVLPSNSGEPCDNSVAFKSLEYFKVLT